MNWRESLLIAIRQGTSAKDAKAPSAPDDSDLPHLLHTHSPKSPEEDSPAERVTIDGTLDRPREPGPLEGVLKGLAIELWSDRAGCLFIVADEEDARRLGEPRGAVYTADELRRVVQIGDPAIVLEIHEWKRRFDARLREYQERKGGA
jgi:hypothetical protein